MNKYDISFILNSELRLILELTESLECVDCCYRGNIILSQGCRKISLSNDSIRYDMERLSAILKKALSKDLQLDTSISEDIGYLCNEYYQNKEGFVLYDFIDGGSDWVGYRYHLWESCKNKIRYMTWIYNDKNGTIIFEVTPCYPYLFCDPAEEPDYVSYDQWIKDYKPYLVKTISTEVAQQWLEQANSIVEQIGLNVERWKREDVST